MNEMQKVVTSAEVLRSRNATRRVAPSTRRRHGMASISSKMSREVGAYQYV